jgi:hypothetical protein
MPILKVPTNKKNMKKRNDFFLLVISIKPIRKPLSVPQGTTLTCIRYIKYTQAPSPAREKAQGKGSHYRPRSLSTFFNVPAKASTYSRFNMV